MIYHIAICDDEPADVKYLSALVSKWADAAGNATVIDAFPSAEAFLFRYTEGKAYDVLLLDIEMPGLNGMELAKKIRKSDEELAIVFITGYSDYISEGYDVSALHYLLKPVDEQKLFVCLDRAVQKKKTAPPLLLIECGGERLRLLQSEIVYLEAFAHSTVIAVEGQNFETGESIGSLEKRLEPTLFVKPHRSYLVGLKHIEKIGKTELTLDSGARIPVSRRLYADVNRAFIRFFRGD